HWMESRQYGGYTVASGFDGAVNWSQDRSGASHRLNSEFAQKLARSESWILRRGWCRANSAAIGAPADKTVAAHTYSVFQVTPDGGAPIELWMDPASGLPFRTIEQLAESRLSRTYVAWTTLPDGTPVPREEYLEYPEDESAETLTFSSISRSTSVTTSAYGEPAPPHDYTVLGGHASTTVSYESDVDRIFVPVTIDGNGPLMFELDTGGHLLLTADAAGGLGLKPVGAFSSTGGGQGVLKAGFVRVHETRIGDAVIRDQPAKVLPLRSSSNDRGPRAPRSGILGLELFERFAVQLNRSAHSLTLTPLSEFRYQGKGTALPLRFTEDAPLTQGAIQGIAGDVELDTGNAGPAILEGYWATSHGLSDKFSGGVVTSGSGVGGDYRETVNRAKLTLGPFDLPNELVSYAGVVERGAESVRSVAGNFGEPILQQFNIAFDYAHYIVWLDPLPGREPRAFNRAGLGLAKRKPDQFTVTLILDGSPAARAGLVVGDRITAVDGRPASTMAVSDARSLYLKPPGTRISLTVLNSAGEAKDIPITLQELIQ
ncbi:MAG TPA: aspartyl protease family protein, partial [Steroidobacteraceae bacterium]|nr:aspartyl protease family protein [Steroidobacteraceae bacterium]